MRPALTVVPSTSSTTRSPRVFPCAVRPPIDFEAPTPTPQRDRLLGGRPQACACVFDHLLHETRTPQRTRSCAAPATRDSNGSAVGMLGKSASHRNCHHR